jgi:hypothetical protein
VTSNQGFVYVSICWKIFEISSKPSIAGLDRRHSAATLGLEMSGPGVGRTPWSAADALVGLYGSAQVQQDSGVHQNGFQFQGFL